MIKHMILSLTLLFSSVVLATTLETNLTFTKGESVSVFSETVKLADDQDRVSFEKDGIRYELVIVSKAENLVELQVTFYITNQNGVQELIASPTLLAEYDNPAQVTLTDDATGNSLNLEVIITRD